jgi:hypothetical protein
MVLVVLLGRRVRTGNPVEVDKRKRGVSQIAINHATAWINFLPCLDRGPAQLARNRVVAAGTDIDVKQSGHSFTLLNLVSIDSQRERRASRLHGPAPN